MDNEIQAQGAWYSDQKPDFQDDPPKPTSPKEFKKIGKLCDVFINLLLLVAGIWIGWEFATVHVQKQAVEKGYGRWEQNVNTEKLNFKWNK